MGLDPFLSEIALFSFNFAPRGWAQCNGQLLPIAQNQAIFALLGTTYGGDGKTTFALPDLRGRIAVGVGQGSGLSDYTLGERSGTESVAVTAAQIPAHTHAVAPTAVSGTLRARNAAGNQQTPAGGVPAADASGTVSLYSDAPPDAGMNAGAIAFGGGITASATGGGQSHENRQPYLAMTFCIALQGVFPAQS
jgi:microcystin-dependent protein